MPPSGTVPPTCWFCGAPVSPARAEVESVLRLRTADQGGPFLTFSCPRCRTLCGALRNRLGAWLFYPLEGATEPSLVERVVPRTGREHLAKARAWWLVHADDVERFRAARPQRPRRASPPPPRGAPTGAPPRTRRGASAVAGARQVLGVGAQATLQDVRSAWRAAVKRWHPDRIPTSDPVVIAESTRRFQEMRAAYEALVAELSSR